MNTAIVITDPAFGPWVIPSRGQTMITNHYAKNLGVKVDLTIPEPLFSNLLSTTRWSKDNKGLTCAILCSIHQLPQRADAVEGFLDDMAEIEFHFCLEALSGKGRNFLCRTIEEAKIFQQSQTIQYDRVYSYQDLFELMQAQFS